MINVSGDDLAPPQREIREDFLHQHGKCIRLFAGRTACTPDPELVLAACLFRRDDLRQATVGKRFQLFILTEHVGFVRGNQISQRLHLFAIAIAVTDPENILLGCGQPENLHALLHPFLEEVGLIVLKMEAQPQINLLC